MGLFDIFMEGFSSANDEANENSVTSKPLSKFTGKHCLGFNAKEDAKIAVELYFDRIVFKNKSAYLAEYCWDDIISIDYRYEDVHTDSSTTAHEEVGLASSVAMAKGDWAAAYFLKPNSTNFETKHKFERHYFFEFESFKNSVVLQVEESSDLFNFVEIARELLYEYENEGFDSYSDDVQIKGMTDEQFVEFCKKYLDYYGFSDIKEFQDGNVNLLATKDEVKYAIRCINATDKVKADCILAVKRGRKANRCHVGLVMTNGYFTDEAIAVAEEKLILIWDRDRLE